MVCLWLRHVIAKMLKGERMEKLPSDRQPGRSRATYYILKAVGGLIIERPAYHYAARHEPIHRYVDSAWTGISMCRSAYQCAGRHINVPVGISVGFHIWDYLSTGTSCRVRRGTAWKSGHALFPVLPSYTGSSLIIPKAGILLRVTKNKRMSQVTD